MSSVEGVRMGRIGGSEGIIFLIYIWVGASDGGEKAVRCLCGPSDTRHVAFPQKITLPMVIQTIRGTRIKLWWPAMFGLSSLGDRQNSGGCYVWVEQFGNRQKACLSRSKRKSVLIHHLKPVEGADEFSTTKNRRPHI